MLRSKSQRRPGKKTLYHNIGPSLRTVTNEPAYIISYKIPCASSEDSDQPAQRSLIRVFAGYYVGSPGS